MRELDDRKGEISRVAEDGKRSREGLRDELRRGEAEIHELRDRVNNTAALKLESQSIDTKHPSFA